MLFLQSPTMNARTYPLSSVLSPASTSVHFSSPWPAAEAMTVGSPPLSSGTAAAGNNYLPGFLMGDSPQLTASTNISAKPFSNSRSIQLSPTHTSPPSLSKVSGLFALCKHLCCCRHYDYVDYVNLLTYISNPSS